MGANGLAMCRETWFSICQGLKTPWLFRLNLRAVPTAVLAFPAVLTSAPCLIWHRAVFSLESGMPVSTSLSCFMVKQAKMQGEVTDLSRDSFALSANEHFRPKTTSNSFKEPYLGKIRSVVGRNPIAKLVLR